MSEKRTEYPFVSIVIPTLNRKTDIVECLDSILNLDYPKNSLELIVWDNGSTDGTPEAIKLKNEAFIQKGFSRVEIVKSKENLGPYVPYNQVQSRLNKESQYMLGLDDDVVLEKDCLAKLVEVTRTDHGAGVVGGSIRYFDFPDKTILSGGWINWWLGRFIDLNTDKRTKCDYVIGCCWLIDRKVFNMVGGFDEDYFTMQWEMDFCIRVQKKGFYIYYQPEAIIKHKVPFGGKRSGLYYQFRNKLMLIKKNASPLQKMISLTLYTLFWLPKILLQSLTVNKGINPEELRIILIAMYHGAIGKTGKQEI